MAVNLWQSLIEEWEHPSLNNLLSSDRVFVGQKEDDLDSTDAAPHEYGDLPFARLFTLDDNPEERSSTKIYSQETVQIECYHITHADARALQKAWRDRFDRRDLALTLDDGTFQSFIRQSGGRVVEENGIYHAFDVYVLYKSKGV